MRKTMKSALRQYLIAAALISVLAVASFTLTGFAQKISRLTYQASHPFVENRQLPLLLRWVCGKRPGSKSPGGECRLTCNSRGYF
jgi:hypothetical protein